MQEQAIDKTVRHWLFSRSRGVEAIGSFNKERDIPEYEPYGIIRMGAGPAMIPGHTYTGHMLDIETGMYFAPYRNYSPMSARWLTKDPLGFVDGTNEYKYVANNPVINVDPDGRVIETITDVCQLGYDVWHGNWVDAGIDTIAFVVP